MNDPRQNRIRVSLFENFEVFYNRRRKHSAHSDLSQARFAQMTFPNLATTITGQTHHESNNIMNNSPLKALLVLNCMLCISINVTHAEEQADLQKENGFVILFDGRTFKNWEHAGNWVIEDGSFYRKAQGGTLTYTAATVPDDFELRFEWKVSKGCNSGVYYRPGQVEYQILDNIDSPYGENARQSAASIFFCMAPNQDVTQPVGQWNTARLICQGTIIEHWLNGERVLSFDYADPKWSKYVELLSSRGGVLTGRGGKLWLQDHGQDVWFRNLRWREIPKNETILPDPNFQPLPVTGVALEKENARVEKMLKAKIESHQ